MRERFEKKAQQQVAGARAAFNQALAANGGIALRLQSAGLVAAVAELGSLGA